MCFVPYLSHHLYAILYRICGSDVFSAIMSQAMLLLCHSKRPWENNFTIVHASVIYDQTFLF